MNVRTIGAGPTVLLVHGIPGSSGVWSEASHGLEEAGFSVLAPDLLGFGASDRPGSLDELWVEAQATALADMLDALGTTPAITVGHDYGAPISVILACRRSDLVSSLVLAAGNLFTDTPIPMPLNTLTWPMIGGPSGRVVLSTPMLHMILRIGVGHPAVRLDPAFYLGDGAQRRAIRTIFSGALRELGDRYAEVETALGTLRQPTAVLWGDRDPFFGVEQGQRAADAIPGASLRIESGAGHFLPAERPASIVETVLRLHASTTVATP